ncbi:type II restriction endonuclease subunit M [Streptomyces sp. S816]|uniref:N-6 DNA methylase n=1 Tax=Streptomyces sp. S816 TaxID=2283197 RepID=UPI00109C611C|nr:N-6 DNA methylase [Streptomyces sp. S816]TGZ12564.1 type II restriction endonuclease subunit M [Streptomyces sp. S816]
MSSPPAVPVTLAEIARLAGVGRAAVSNWRRRHSTFPPRIGGTDVSPHFSLADVEEWLRSNKKLGKATSREWLWPRFEALGDRNETGLAIAVVGRLLAAGEGDDGGPDDVGSGAVRAAVELGQREGPSDILTFLLRRWLDTYVRQITTTPEPLADLMADLALWVRESIEGEPREDVVTVLDPACGVGHLLAAAATAVPAALNRPAALLGCDRDPVLTALSDVRLALLPRPGTLPPMPVIASGDSLRADPLIGTQADMVLCNPPSNERDWGYEDLATDARWVHGMPPRTEPELAWVQHCLARLRPGGSAVLLLPPTVAARKAGRRIRGSLLRTGALRAVVALPPGAAAPHSVSLHLWVLRRSVAGETPSGPEELLLVDAAARFPRSETRENGPEWSELGAFIRSVVGASGGRAAGGARNGATAEDADTTAWATVVPVIDLLDDEVDLTPGRHIMSAPGHAGPRLTDSWNEVRELLDGLQTERARLAALDLTSGAADQPNATVGELLRAGALSLRSGRHPTEAVAPEPQHARIPLLTLSDLLLDGSPSGWTNPDDAVVAEPGDVVVVGIAREFSAWVHEGPPMAVGPQVHVLRADPQVLDHWFLAGSLKAPANARHAGTHASSSSRIDVRRLQVRRLSLPEQQHYSEVFRHLAAFERLVERLGIVARKLGQDLGDELAAGRLAHGK